MVTEKVKGENFSLINRLPDNDTMEIILYGSAYADVKAALFRIDEIEDILVNRGDRNLDILMKQKDTVSKYIQEMMTDPYKEIRKDASDYELKMNIRKHLDIVAACKWCNAKRAMVMMYGRIIGAQEQGVHIRASPEQVKTWRNSVLQVAKTPIEYETVRAAYGRDRRH